MEKIASFTINHDLLTPGMYVSRVDGDVVTYDLRLKFPNRGDYLAQGALHTLEHLIATYARSSNLSDRVIYFGPMGCRTGFYLLQRQQGGGDFAYPGRLCLCRRLPGGDPRGQGHRVRKLSGARPFRRPGRSGKVPGGTARLVPGKDGLPGLKRVGRIGT